MKLSLSTLAIAALFSANAMADVKTFPAANYCSEDAELRSTAVTDLIEKEGIYTAFMLVNSEVVGPTSDGFFTYNPLFARTERKFNCSIPLDSDMGNIEVATHGKSSNLSGMAGGCDFSLMRRISDGGEWKWIRYGQPGGFNWAYQPDSFTYVTNIDNKNEAESSLLLRCRTVWDKGTVALGNITLTY